MFGANVTATNFFGDSKEPLETPGLQRGPFNDSFMVNKRVSTANFGASGLSRPPPGPGGELKRIDASNLFASFSPKESTGNNLMVSFSPKESTGNPDPRYQNFFVAEQTSNTMYSMKKSLVALKDIKSSLPFGRSTILERSGGEIPTSVLSANESLRDFKNSVSAKNQLISGTQFPLKP